MNAIETSELTATTQFYGSILAMRSEVEQILRLRLQMREENIRNALKYLNNGEYEMCRITLETFAT